MVKWVRASQFAYRNFAIMEFVLMILISVTLSSNWYAILPWNCNKIVGDDPNFSYTPQTTTLIYVHLTKGVCQSPIASSLATPPCIKWSEDNTWKYWDTINEKDFAFKTSFASGAAKTWPTNKIVLGVTFAILSVLWLVFCYVVWINPEVVILKYQIFFCLLQCMVVFFLFFSIALCLLTDQVQPEPWKGYFSGCSVNVYPLEGWWAELLALCISGVLAVTIMFPYFCGPKWTNTTQKTTIQAGAVIPYDENSDKDEDDNDAEVGIRVKPTVTNQKSKSLSFKRNDSSSNNSLRSNKYAVENSLYFKNEPGESLIESDEFDLDLEI